ncbi:MAG: Tm-1-like ATP-binding domain-containing protein, partial [Desulfobacterales bacterium]
MEKKLVVAVVGTFDSKADEHFFLKERIEQHGLQVLTINVGTAGPAPKTVDLDLFKTTIENIPDVRESRDTAIAAMIDEAQTQVKRLYEQ